MSKYKQLAKHIVTQAIKAGVLVGVAGAVYAGVHFFGENVAKQKTDAESKYQSDNSLLKNFRDQIDQSSASEKRYAELVADRSSQDFALNQEALQVWLKSTANQYRLSKVKFTRATEVPTTKQELTNFPGHSVSLRPSMKLEFEAVSDLHVFSFIQALTRSAPGIVRIDGLELKRKSDLREDVLSNIRGGTMPLLTEAKIEFSWIGLSAKTPKSSDAAQGK